MKSTIKLISLILLVGLPTLAFASTGGDSTFTKIVTDVTGYLTGSLGLLFVIFGFLGAAAAIAGFAPMKVLFPVFGLTIALHYGPGILTTLFGATGDYNSVFLHHPESFTIGDLVLVMLASIVFVLGYIKNKVAKHECQ